MMDSASKFSMEMSADDHDTHEDELSDFDDLGADAPLAKKGKRASANGKSKAKAASHNASSALEHEADGSVAGQRKLQNRVAQREFRQRKLQYVKDLEARVEFLSTSKDDQLEALKAMLRGLMEENKQLRTLVQQISGFIGEGLGGHTQRLGFSNVTDFEEYVSQSDRDTIHRIHEGWKTRYSKNTKVDGLNSAESASPHSATHNNAVESHGRNSRSGPSSPAGGATSGSKSDSTKSGSQGATTVNGDAHSRKHPRASMSDGAGTLITGKPTTHNITTAPPAQPTQQSESSLRTQRQALQSTAATQTQLQSTLPYLTIGGTSTVPSAQYCYNTGAPVGSTLAAAGPSLFFDVADPLNISNTPSSAVFTNEFMSDFGHTGLTPSYDSTAFGATEFAWPDYNILPSSTPGAYMQLDPVDSNQALQGQSQYTQFDVSRTSQQPSSIASNQVSQASTPIASAAQVQNAASAPSANEIFSSSPLLQAIHLLSYHMRSKAANEGYILPPSLTPTQVQILTAHDSRIDGIIWPSLRDRLIMDTRHDLNAVLGDLLEAVTVHPGDDLLDWWNWEVSDTFITRWKALITDEIVKSSNKWRAVRGESLIQL